MYGIKEKSLDATIAKRVQEYSNKPWFNRREKDVVSLKHIPSGELIQVTIEGKGYICEHIRNKIIYGWTYKELDLQREDLGEI
jgi:hypothetical protein